MISTDDLQRRYVKIYKCLMNYIFDFTIVEALADFEIAVFRVFPDMDDVERRFNRLVVELKRTDLEDDKLDKALTKFAELLEDKTVFYEIDSFKEVIDNENRESE